MHPNKKPFPKNQSARDNQPEFPDLTQVVDELYGSIALQWANYIGDNKHHNKITSHQLRRHYNEVKGLQRQLQNEGSESWKTIFPLLKLVKARVSYNSVRDGGVPAQFKTFVDKGIDGIKDSESFHHFCLFFEAVVGYLYGNQGVQK